MLHIWYNGSCAGCWLTFRSASKFTWRLKPALYRNLPPVTSLLEWHVFHLLSTSGVTVDSYSCLDPGIPVNGIRYGQDFSIGSTVSFGCDSGYRLSHEEPLVCEKNHWWSHPLPTCDGESERDGNCGFKVTLIYFNYIRGQSFVLLSYILWKTAVEKRRGGGGG